MPSFPQTGARCENRGLGTTCLLRHPFGRTSGWRSFNAAGPDGQNRCANLAFGPLTFGGIVMAYGIWEDISHNSTGSFARVNERGNVVLEKQRDGHFHATVVINGAPIDTLVDTGATLTVLTPRGCHTRGI